MNYIVKPLLRHPLVPLLVMLQVTLACAIAGNALFLLQQQLVPVLAPDGIDDPAHLIFLHNISLRGTPPSVARVRGLEAGLQKLPSVTSISYSVALPMTNSIVIQRDIHGANQQATVNATVYVGDNLMKTFGLRLVAGRDFSEEEKSIVLSSDMGFKNSGPIIVTRTLADRLYPGEKALGRLVGYKGQSGGKRTIVGIVDHLIRNEFTQDNRSLDYALLLPGLPDAFPFVNFAVRTQTSNVTKACKPLLDIVKNELGPDLQPGSDVSCDAYSTLRSRMLAPRRAAVWLLSGVTFIVLVVTLTGIAGMVNYWVQQRTRRIGICRALGARRSNILHELLIENLLVMSVGMVLGLVAAYGINLWLMRHYALLRLPWVYLPVGPVLLLVLGQLAALAPARRASKIPPIVATRAI